MSGLTDRLRQVAGQATPGPWLPKDNRGDIYSADGRYICDTLIEMAQETGLGEVAKADAEHIATFDPVLVGAMLDVIDAAEQVNELHVRDALARFREVAG